MIRMLRMKLYHQLVNRVPMICMKYHGMRERKTSIFGRIFTWCYLLVLNVGYYCFHMKSLRVDLRLYPDEGKKVLVGKSESALSLRESPQELAKRLEKYDVISFDLFDTLLFRPFSQPTDLFYLVGEKLGYLDFTRLRIEMEHKAREKCNRIYGHREVTLSDIYDVMEEQVGIPKEKGMQAELETEQELCFGNPYFLEVIKCLLTSKKRIIAVSDMYLPKEVLSKIVDKCGFGLIQEIYVSCEYGLSKNQGGLYQKVQKDCIEKVGPTEKEVRIVHIGDNQYSDVQMAKKNGFASVYYQNINEAGKPYRIEDLSVVAGSIYRGIVNAHIHNGLKEYSPDYEFGFIYGGPIVLGYCQFIHEYVKNNQIDKILFLARDGDILNQAYQVLYPDEWGTGKTEYVYWSRLAATKMAARYFKYDYFRRFLYHKVNQGYLVSDILESMELLDMMETLTRLSGGAIQATTQFTSRNVAFIKGYLMSNWEEVLAHYDEQMAAGKAYYEKVLRGKKKVVAVDVGWAGSGAVTLNHIVKDVWNLDCEIIGLLLGTNSIHNAEPNASESLLYSGKLVSYVFSQSHNRELWKQHDAGKGHNLIIEQFFGCPREGTFQKFVLDCVGLPKMICKEETDKRQGEVQEGMLQFVGLTRNLEYISSADVGAVMGFFCNKNCDGTEYVNREIHI